MSLDKELLQELQQAFGRSDAPQDPLMRELLKERLVTMIQARIDSLRAEIPQVTSEGSMAQWPRFHTLSSAALGVEARRYREYAAEALAKQQNDYNSELIVSELERRIPEVRRLEQEIDEAREKIRQILRL